MNAQESKAIVVRNLDCGYGRKVLLRGLNFEVRDGEIFVIMGESGCGKSTLLKHLIGLHPPLTGEVVFLGRDFPARAARSARKSRSVLACSTKAARCGVRSRWRKMLRCLSSSTLR